MRDVFKCLLVFSIFLSHSVLGEWEPCDSQLNRIALMAKKRGDARRRVDSWIVRLPIPSSYNQGATSHSFTYAGGTQVAVPGGFGDGGLRGVGRSPEGLRKEKGLRTQLNYSDLAQLMFRLMGMGAYFRKDLGSKNLVTVEPISEYGRSEMTISLRYSNSNVSYPVDYVAEEKRYFDLPAPGGIVKARSLRDEGIYFYEGATRNIKNRLISSRWVSVGKGAAENSVRPWLHSRQAWVKPLVSGDVETSAMFLSNFLQAERDGIGEEIGTTEAYQTIEPAEGITITAPRDERLARLEAIQRRLSEQETEPWAKMTSTRLGADLIYYDEKGRRHKIGFFNVDDYLQDSNGEIVRGAEIDIEIVPEFLPDGFPMDAMDDFYTFLSALTPDTEENTRSNHKIERLLGRRP